MSDSNIISKKILINNFLKEFKPNFSFTKEQEQFTLDLLFEVDKIIEKEGWDIQQIIDLLKSKKIIVANNNDIPIKRSKRGLMQTSIYEESFDKPFDYYNTNSGGHEFDWRRFNDANLAIRDYMAFLSNKAGQVAATAVVSTVANFFLAGALTATSISSTSFFATVPWLNRDHDTLKWLIRKIEENRWNTGEMRRYFVMYRNTLKGIRKTLEGFKSTTLLSVLTANFAVRDVMDRNQKFIPFLDKYIDTISKWGIYDMYLAHWN
ncbi:hypothetical protein CJJ23_00235 [Mycoplasmopsis agassizii]|uniref:Uncharacterized protein n=1 Tax=Mycoplasmopsis agassizii TaxID=33922 RepID=A0A269TJY0_9BACT|nr:hypothetical protein [Mycoplasmopsis agassizii]PAK21759.1 hypothetical protein CJJ23_00235 [Mycoplasmopsis agassizii]